MLGSADWNQRIGQFDAVPFHLIAPAERSRRSLRRWRPRRSSAARAAPFPAGSRPRFVVGAPPIEPLAALSVPAAAPHPHLGEPAGHRARARAARRAAVVLFPDRDDPAHRVPVRTYSSSSTAAATDGHGPRLTHVDSARLLSLCRNSGCRVQGAGA